MVNGRGITEQSRARPCSDRLGKSERIFVVRFDPIERGESNCRLGSGDRPTYRAHVVGRLESQDANGYHGVLRKTQKKISSASHAHMYAGGMNKRRYGLPVTALFVNPRNP